MNKYIRLPNGNKIKYYSFAITNALIVKFIDTNVNAIKDFFGVSIIDYMDITNENDDILESHNLYMKLKTITSESTTITEYEDRIVKDSWMDEDGVQHEAITEKIPREVPCTLVTVILEKPSTSEELDNIKSVVGIVNTNNMTLDEFKSYYKEQIGKECTAAIENGVDVETTLGKKHFSYTIEDQSNVKDLIITAIFTDFTLPLPYHADGELCTLYQPNDIQKIYMLLCSNKTYHTTYCNVLNAMINEAKDLVSVKAITYGMEITDEKYLEVMTKINESKDALLTYVEKKFTLNKSDSENPKEESNKSDDLKEESNNE